MSVLLDYQYRVVELKQPGARKTHCCECDALDGLWLLARRPDSPETLTWEILKTVRTDDGTTTQEVLQRGNKDQLLEMERPCGRDPSDIPPYG